MPVVSPKTGSVGAQGVRPATVSASTGQSGLRGFPSAEAKHTRMISSAGFVVCWSVTISVTSMMALTRLVYSLSRHGPARSWWRSMLSGERTEMAATSHLAVMTGGALQFGHHFLARAQATWLESSVANVVLLVTRGVCRGCRIQVQEVPQGPEGVPGLQEQQTHLYELSEHQDGLFDAWWSPRELTQCSASVQ